MELQMELLPHQQVLQGFLINVPNMEDPVQVKKFLFVLTCKNASNIMNVDGAHRIIIVSMVTQKVVNFTTQKVANRGTGLNALVSLLCNYSKMQWLALPLVQLIHTLLLDQLLELSLHLVLYLASIVA